LTIGRAAECGLVLDDQFVSHHHARIDVRDDGVWITDLASRNGTYLDGEPLVAPRRFSESSAVRIGSTIVRVAASQPMPDQDAVPDVPKPRRPGLGQMSVLYLEPSHAGSTIIGAILAVIFGAVALAALAYRTSTWPKAWRFDTVIPDRALVITAAVAGGLAILAATSAAVSGRRWHIARAVERISNDPTLASILPDSEAMAPSPRAALIPPLDVRFVKPRTLPRLARKQRVTAAENVAGHRPLQIAYLRLFENRPRIRTFIEGAWREFGSVWLLRSSASVTPAEYRAALREGGLGQLFISSKAQLSAQFHADRPYPRGRQVFRDVGTTTIRVRDRYGSYPVHAILCHGSFWKEAVDDLLARVDLVALDLSGFRPNNLGTRYELQRVIDRFPVERLVLLADEHSNKKFLDEQIRDAWSRMAAGSPNAVDGSRVAIVAITDYFVRSTSTQQDGSTSETVKLVAQRSQTRRVVVMAQDRLDRSRIGTTGTVT
jgi:hypothetical protein